MPTDNVARIRIVIVISIGKRACPERSRWDVLWTNNGSEQVIGKMKIHKKSFREEKSEQGVLNGLMLASNGAW